eukprot:184267-Chlamydomonas_euryale.AAC.5
MAAESDAGHAATMPFSILTRLAAGAATGVAYAAHATPDDDAAVTGASAAALADATAAAAGASAHAAPADAACAAEPPARPTQRSAARRISPSSGCQMSHPRREAA